MKRIQEWDDDDGYDNNTTNQEKLHNESAIIEIREVFSEQKTQYSRQEVLKRIPDSKLRERIQYYRSVILELEGELTRRSMDNESVADRDYYSNVSDVGSFRFISPEFNFEMGFSSKHNAKRKGRNSNGLATAKRRNKSVAVKLSDFINKLTLTEDEKVNLLEEWRKITDGI